MPHNTIPLPPNIPVTIKLEDPQRDAGTLYDFDLRIGRYLTLTGEMLALPRQAAILLNSLDVQPGEEITVCRRWSGKAGESHEWTVELTARTEQALCQTCGTPHPDDVTTSHHPDNCRCGISLCGGMGPKGCIWSRMIKRPKGTVCMLFAFAAQARLIAQKESALQSTKNHEEPSESTKGQQ
jgi:hypothetical protein